MNRRRLPGKMVCRIALFLLAGLLTAGTGVAQSEQTCNAPTPSANSNKHAGRNIPDPTDASSSNDLFLKDVSRALFDLTYTQGALSERDSAHLKNSAAPLTDVLAELKTARVSLQSILGVTAVQFDPSYLPKDLNSSLSDAQSVLSCELAATGDGSASKNRNALQKASDSLAAVQTALAQPETGTQARKLSVGFLGLITKNSLQIASCVFSIGTLLLLWFIFRSRHEVETSAGFKQAALQMASDLTELDGVVKSSKSNYGKLFAKYQGLDAAYVDLQRKHNQLDRQEEPAIVPQQLQPELQPVLPAPSAAAEKEVVSAKVPSASKPPVGPLEDYNQARLLGGSEAEDEFKKKYSPCISVACTNLSQRSMPGVQFLFKPAARASFLAAAAGDGKTYLLPQFSTEYPYARPLMEGPFIYPSGEAQELCLLKAGELKSVGEEWELAERGVFGV